VREILDRIFAQKRKRRRRRKNRTRKWSGERTLTL
jgi:hypothetical protein